MDFARRIGNETGYDYARRQCGSYPGILPDHSRALRVRNNVYDATNFRLAELSLGYTFRNLFGGVIRNLSLSVIGRNLFFIYKNAPIDPDIALSTKNGLGAFDIFNMPATRSIGVNLKIDF